MEKKPVREISLDNGLTLCIYDESRPVTEDRWLVRMALRIEVPTAPVTFPRAPENPEVLELLGPVAVFEQKKERHFIEAEKKEEIFQLICDSFLESSLTYLSHPDFARKFVIKQYRGKLKRKGW